MVMITNLVIIEAEEETITILPVLGEGKTVIIQDEEHNARKLFPLNQQELLLEIQRVAKTTSMWIYQMQNLTRFSVQIHNQLVNLLRITIFMVIFTNFLLIQMSIGNG